MKKIIVAVLFICCFAQVKVLASQSKSLEVSPAAGVLCNKSMTVCSVGRHVIRSSGKKKKPLYVSDGIVCTYDKKLCTNGISYIRSGKIVRPLRPFVTKY